MLPTLVLLQPSSVRNDQAFGVDSVDILASSKLSPLIVKNESNRFATPTPADPAPKNNIRWSARGSLDAAEAIRAALMKPESTTAPVPWIYERYDKMNETSRKATAYIIIVCTILKGIKVLEGVVCTKIFELYKKFWENVPHR